MTRAPYELIESLFGTWVANNFNTICGCLCFLGIMLYSFGGRIDFRAKSRSGNTIKRNSDYSDSTKKQSKKWKNPQWTPSGWVYNEKTKQWEGPDYPHINGKRMSPTGWTFNEETQLWEPPESIQRESDQKWEWDEEKRIWIDRDKRNKQEKYKKFREGKEPTFEEWKAQRGKDSTKAP